MTTATNEGHHPPPKQIRFVNNQGQPPSKRRRINAACLTCRKRKTRCAGERPVCSTCTKNGHLCQGYSDITERKKDPASPPSVKRERAGSGDELDDHTGEGNDKGDAERRRWSPTDGGVQNPPGPAGAKLGRGSLNVDTMPIAQMPMPDTYERGPEQEDDQGRKRPQRFPTYGRHTSLSDDSRSSNNRSPIQPHTEHHRVPFFRYFGPTAIVPGFKQMVVNVSVRDQRKSLGESLSTSSPASHPGRALFALASPLDVDSGASMEDLPVYDANDPSPTHPLILSLVKTFFLHLGSNYPFLKESRFIRSVQEKRVESILVDSVCALAARFSDHPVFTNGTDGNISRSEYGQVFARRAKAATVDTFPCPSVGAVQACLLMAYETFGENQDSALWMYLGLAIRMAIDVGLQKVVGVKYQGEKDPWITRTYSRKGSDTDANQVKEDSDDTVNTDEQKSVEQERMDTLWSVFVLDRVISSGTGRPVTFRDEDFEFSLPEQTDDPVSGWPAPFPSFIHIIQLYGRVSDVLNKIRDASDLTKDKMVKLAQMENELTKLYQKQDSRLHFNAYNFQEYVKVGQGTTFILLHFWFHALIIILHQPTLLTPFASLSRIHQLLPNSRELSMSSAKTIADILAFAELIDPKSFIGNPFTSQPIYIAGCAFLMESVAIVSQPPLSDKMEPPGPPNDAAGAENGNGPRPNDLKTKHSLLASAASQNYQRCYQSLQQLHNYWGGVKYIITALEQKSKGIWDCETFTNEEYESTQQLPRTSPLDRFSPFEYPSSPSNVPPIAWSITGTTNSPNSSLTLLYQNMNANQQAQMTSSRPPSVPRSAPTPPGNMIYDPIRQSLPESHAMFPPPPYPRANESAMRYSPQMSRTNQDSMSPTVGIQSPSKRYSKYDSLSADEPSMQGGAMSQPSAPPVASFASSSQHPSYEGSMLQDTPSTNTLTEVTSHQQQTLGGSISSSSGMGYPAEFAQSGLASGSYSYLGPAGPITDVITFDSQEIDLNSLGLPTEMMPPWLEYLPGDVLSLFESSGASGIAGNQHHMG